MKYIWPVIAAQLAFGNVLDLPVKYDPFHKAQKIIKSAKKSAKGNFRIKRRLALGGIFNGKAFINGRFYRVGDRVDGAKIVAIKDRYVILLRDGKMRILPLLGRKPVLEVDGR